MTRYNSFRRDADLSWAQVGCGCLMALIPIGLTAAFWGFWGWVAVQLVHAIAK